MRSFILTVVLSICFQGLFAQDNEFDTIYPIVSGNQVSIHQDNAYQNCGFRPGLEHITINDSIINWYQVDTIGMFFGCRCWFDYSVNIDSLNPGTYTVFVYSCYNSPSWSDSTYEGSTQFTIEGPQTKCDSILHLSSTATPCHEYTALKFIQPVDEQYSIKYNTDKLSVVTKGPKIIKVILSNLSGQEVIGVKYNSATEIQLSISSLKKGVYIISLFDNYNIRVNRKLAIL
jgi:hypothetical protein